MRAALLSSFLFPLPVHPLGVQPQPSSVLSFSVKKYLRPVAAFFPFPFSSSCASADPFLFSDYTSYTLLSLVQLVRLIFPEQRDFQAFFSRFTRRFQL